MDGKARNLKCKCCEKVLTGGIYILKHHLAGTSKDVRACILVPEEVKKLMLDTIATLQQKLLKKSMSREDNSVSNSENARKGPSEEEIGDSSNIFKRGGTQTTINSIFMKNDIQDAC